MATSLGHVTVELMARIGEGEPQSLGFVQLPLTIKSVSTGTIETHVRDAVDYARECLLQVFGGGES